jgi:hypothetical protein
MALSRAVCVSRIDFIGSVGCCCPAGGNSGYLRAEPLPPVPR